MDTNITEVVIIIGMPGSGKTTLMHSAKYSGYARFDNMFKYPDGLTQLRAALACGRSVVVSDIELCDPDTLRRFLRTLPPGTTLRFHYFCNNPEQCKRNVITRALKRMTQEIESINRLTEKYRPDNPQPVYGQS